MSNTVKRYHFSLRSINRQKRALYLLSALSVGIIITFLIDCFWGATSLSPLLFCQTLLHPSQVDPSVQTIVWDIRLPYALMALVIGSCLGLAGAELQTTLHNPLCSPFTLGFSAAGACGASLFILSDMHLSFISDTSAIALCAFAGCCLCAVLHKLLLKRAPKQANRVILCGIALLFSFQALSAFFQFLSNEETLQNLVFWTLGSLSKVTWPAPTISLITLLCVLPFSLKAAPQLTLLRLGEEHAAGLGINVRRLRNFSLMRVSILCAISVAFTGIIGFIGLIAPHIARLLIGENHRYYLIASTLCGALLLLSAAYLAQWLVTATLLPTGIVTALIGIPFFLFLILKNA